MVTVFLSKALICIAGQCFSALVGADTPAGEFTMYKRIVQDPAYKGSVIQFSETEQHVFAIHRVWTQRPAEKRQERIASSNVAQRFITKGCINVTDEVFNTLLDCCQGQTLRIEP